VRELIVDYFSTLDGFGDGGPQPSAYWGYDGPGLQEWLARKLAEDHIQLMGATTYRMMAEFVAQGDDPSFARMTELPKLVFSKTLQPPLSWANTTIVDEPVEIAVPALKQLDDLPMVTMGSPTLVRSLFEHGLVDRLRVTLFPTMHGREGEGPLFTKLPYKQLELIGTEVLDNRLVSLEYRVS
jgi:dihydrofolate reductase